MYGKRLSGLDGPIFNTMARGVFGWEASTGASYFFLSPEFYFSRSKKETPELAATQHAVWDVRLCRKSAQTVMGRYLLKADFIKSQESEPPMRAIPAPPSPPKNFFPLDIRGIPFLLRSVVLLWMSAVAGLNGRD